MTQLNLAALQGTPFDMAIGVISAILVIAGSFFILVGAIGLVRMPDVFTRMHATSVTETAGAGLLLVGLMLQTGFSLLTLKLFFVLVLIFLTAPVATHALAQAALQAGVDPELSEDRRDREAGSQEKSKDGEG